MFPYGHTAHILTVSGKYEKMKMKKQISHKCTVCSEVKVNKVAEFGKQSDDVNVIIGLQ